MAGAVAAGCVAAAESPAWHVSWLAMPPASASCGLNATVAGSASSGVASAGIKYVARLSV
jgi:hypothetical protein